MPLHKPGEIVYTVGQKKPRVPASHRAPRGEKIFRKEGYSMKYILVIGDGMADHPLDTLGGRTPLEASKKRRDRCPRAPRHPRQRAQRARGLRPRQRHGHHVHLRLLAAQVLFSAAPRSRRRRPASGSPRGDACYRCNMVTYADEDVPFEHKHIISHSAGSIEGRESDELVTMLFDHPDFRPLAEQAGMVIHKGSSFRHLAVQSHVDIKGIQLAPPHDHLGEEIGPILPTGCPNADVLRELMRRAFDILDQHPINVARRAAGKLPANGVWFWAEGTAAALPNFPEHYGSDGGVVSAVPLCHGIGILTGLEAVTVPTATGEWDTDYAAKVAAALGVLKKHDFVALHLEGPDEATHNHDLEHKIYSIERLSADVVAPVTEALRAAGEDFRLLLLSDHMTYMANGAHGADPVPFVLYDSRVSEGSGLPYSEANGRKGPYVDDGAELMDLLFELKKL